MEELTYFLSYAREDSQVVLKLATELRAVGAKLWLDQWDIIVGQHWDHAVGEGLKACQGMIVTLSPASMASQNVLDEVSYALEEKKRVVPILLRSCAIPFRLRRVQYIDLTASYDTGFSQLLGALRSDQPLNPRETQLPLGPEIRQLTVLCCDLVDAATLSERLGVEGVREVIQDYQSACAEVVKHFEGHLGQHQGDRLLVYFGYPLSHEDDALRAVRTGLEIVESIARLNTRLQQEKAITLGVRLGIHTGLVVAGGTAAGGMGELPILGELNLAARLQDLAEPDTIIISSATHRLIKRQFDCQDLGIHALGGLSQPVLVYRVRKEREDQDEPTPLVGREQELGLLRERWAQVAEGRGQVVVLSGEAGIGKSRLVQEVKTHAAGEPHTRLECRCWPYYQHSAFHPVIDLLQRVLQLQREESAEEKLGKLEGTLAHYRMSQPDIVPLLASLLSLPLPERYPPLVMSPQQQRQKTLEALLTIFLTLAGDQPVLFIVEDLHWVDPSTLELVHLLIDQVATAPILTLLTSRPEFRPPWDFRGHVTPVTLSRLPHTQVEAMVARVAGNKALPAEVHQQLVLKTDGVPLFVEELTEMVLESGLLREREGRYELTDPLLRLAIPATLYGTLQARLDRLGRVKAVAQLGAILGREFPSELLQAISPWNEPTLQHGLSQLVGAELLYRRGLPPQVSYTFKHVLIQEVAYQSLLKSDRQEKHQQVAQVLTERFPETAETQPELLAHHYTEAGLSGPAVGYWRQAGQRGLERSAYVEAISHLTKGLGLLNTLPDPSERTRHELLLQTTLGPALMATKGFGAPEVQRAYDRARELCQQMGEAPQLFPVKRGLATFYIVRAELQTARGLAEELLRLAQRTQDPAMLVKAYSMLGTTSFYLGEIASARVHLEQGIALYDPQQHRSRAFLEVGTDPGVLCFIYAAQVMWLLGYPDQALTKSHEARTLAQELSHPFSLAYALDFAALLHRLRREEQAAQERAEAAMALSTKEGFPLWLAIGMILRGATLAEQAQGPEGLAQMRQGLARFQAIGAEVGRPYFLALLAEVYGRGGQVQEGLSTLDEAQAAMQKTGERWCEAELYRHQGALLLARSTEHDAEAEACFHRALEVARHQLAKTLELRAALNLSRLWQRQGKRAEARQMLAGVYSWFTEGCDTPDLQEAQALLEALA